MLLKTWHRSERCNHLMKQTYGNANNRGKNESNWDCFSAHWTNPELHYDCQILTQNISNRLISFFRSVGCSTVHSIWFWHFFPTIQLTFIYLLIKFRIWCGWKLEISQNKNATAFGRSTITHCVVRNVYDENYYFWRTEQCTPKWKWFWIWSCVLDFFPFLIRTGLSFIIWMIVYFRSEKYIIV